MLTRHVLVDCGAMLDTPARDGGHGPLLAFRLSGFPSLFFFLHHFPAFFVVSHSAVVLSYLARVFPPDSGAKRMDDVSFAKIVNRVESYNSPHLAQFPSSRVSSLFASPRR
jgi:hypothetical protein